MQGRVVFHLDLDCFYAAVEMRDRPELKRVPLVMGADPRGGRGRGVVCTANYPARRFGIRSAMPISEAWRRCPTAVFLPPDWEKIGPASDAVMDVLVGYADVLEVVGVDEAYLDVTRRCPGASGGIDWGLAGSLALSLQAAVKRATGLSCSIGVAGSKSVAKVASDHRKPHGVTVVRPEDARRFLAPLAVRKIPGCGPKTSALLADEGITRVGELAQREPASMGSLLGSHSEWLVALARAQDDRPVVADHGPRKSRSNERTYLQDQRDSAAVLATAQRLACGLLEDQDGDGRAFSTLTVKVRYTGFETLTRAHSFAVPLDAGSDAATAATNATVHRLMAPLLDGRGVRLVGVRLSNFADVTGQQALWPAAACSPDKPLPSGKVVGRAPRNASGAVQGAAGGVQATLRGQGRPWLVFNPGLGEAWVGIRHAGTWGAHAWAGAS